MVENITEWGQLKQVLKDSEKKYRTIYESSRDAIMIATPEEGFLAGNPATVKMFGWANEQEFISQSPASVSPEYQPDGALSSIKAQQMMAIALKKGTHFFEWKHKRLDGTEFFSTVLLTRMKLNGKNVLQATVRDISDRKLAEQELIEKQKQLEAKTKDLEEINTALNVLLKKREGDKKELEQNVVLNVKKLIEPYLEKLKKSRMNETQNAYLDILASHLKDIISPFAHTLSSKYLHLTSAEIKIASHIKQGKTTKEIASLLNLSSQTIESHRKNLRKKLGIRNNKITLRTHLRTLQ
jgi:PAS domain S-box-containing protein